eukprot:g2814.t1
MISALEKGLQWQRAGKLLEQLVQLQVEDGPGWKGEEDGQWKRSARKAQRISTIDLLSIVCGRQTDSPRDDRRGENSQHSQNHEDEPRMRTRKS